MDKDEYIGYQKLDHNSPEYEEYMNSNEWQKKREEAFLEYGEYCHACKKDQGSFDIHHKTYKHFTDEELSELIPLCRKCHDGVHEKHRSEVKNPTRLSLTLITDIFIAERTARLTASIDGYTRIQLPKVTNMGSRMTPPKTRRPVEKSPNQDQNFAKKKAKKKTNRRLTPLTFMSTATCKQYFRAYGEEEVRAAIVAYIKKLSMDKEIVIIALAITSKYDYLNFESSYGETPKNLMNQVQLAKVWYWDPSKGVFRMTKKAMACIFNIQVKDKKTSYKPSSTFNRPPQPPQPRLNTKAYTKKFVISDSTLPTIEDIIRSLEFLYKNKKISSSTAIAAKKISSTYDSIAKRSRAESTQGISASLVVGIWEWSDLRPDPILASSFFNRIVRNKQIIAQNKKGSRKFPPR